MTDLHCAIYTAITRSITRQTAGTIPTAVMTTTVGTAEKKGETSNPEILRLRLKMMQNACALLMCSRGTPMFLSGDEFADTRFGNNNPYCQDNEIPWLDWSLLSKNQALFAFFQYMIAFRKQHPAIRRNLEPSYTSYPP